MDNLPGFIKAEMVPLLDIAKIVINLQEKRANVKLIPQFISKNIPYEETALTSSFEPKIENGQVTYTHEVVVRVPFYNIDVNFESFLERFLLEGGILLLTDTNNVQWVAGSEDSPLELLIEDLPGSASRTNFKGKTLMFSSVAVHSLLRYYVLS